MNGKLAPPPPPPPPLAPSDDARSATASLFTSTGANATDVSSSNFRAWRAADHPDGAFPAAWRRLGKAPG
eukprot:CAMPEP_0114676232 /NCGR_PEP_ID=MMETSP0191-20121206/48960_1 /TAXON_ID=126664 /ORGANISM="Sorites sp." /LENGTH=69 /DNA_ID=CAMNT_0001946885 /DNA_START=183 /DNA_END=392 /DNA_ORIENTATION=+